MADTDRFMYSDGNQNYMEPVYDVGGGRYSLFMQDANTGGILVIDNEHHEIHEGDHYFVGGTVTLDSASSDLIDFAVITPDTTKWAHMTFSITSTGQTTYTLYENVVYNTDGTPVTAINNNRNSANVSALEITTNPTGFTPAASDAIFSQTIGLSGAVALVVGGNVERDHELILKQNTKYIFRLDSQTAGNQISYDAEWYEHTAKA